MERVKILFIGDPHVQISNIPEVELFMEKMIFLANEKEPDLIIIGGDILHTHERLHTLAMNKAYELVNNMRIISKTYVLVGNHDMCNNQQYLSNNHWLNGMKEWDNTVIVDKVISETIKGEKFIFCPYVPPGRFEEALNTLEGDWLNASCIFAHQEFFGCKMGAITSIEGDKWPEDFPNVISGHIHSRQRTQKNIYYPGSAMQHAFGESTKNIIAYLIFENNEYILEEINLQLPRKKIIYMDIEDLDSYEIPKTNDKLKITLSGNHEQFKALKKTNKYKKILKKGVKVVFKPKKICMIDESKKVEFDGIKFKSILNNIIYNEGDIDLIEAYELIINE